jgi:hypothetical protein
MREFNQRQYRRMLDSIAAFEQGRVPPDTLVTELEGLLNAVDAPNAIWKQNFLHNWGKLEDERAFALFKGLSTFDEEATGRLRAAVAKLKLLVIEEIDDPADSKRNP